MHERLQLTQFSLTLTLPLTESDGWTSPYTSYARNGAYAVSHARMYGAARHGACRLESSRMARLDSAGNVALDFAHGRWRYWRPQSQKWKQLLQVAILATCVAYASAVAVVGT